jgi:hypothetical protein
MAGLTFAAAAAMAFGPFGNRNGRNSQARVAAPWTSQAPPADANDFSPGPQLAERPLYPYSVIPGGVEDARELKNAMDRDSLVARHYADFDLSKVHVVRLDHDRMEYVSYRLGDQIFWTNHQLHLLKGESVITDGTHEARTRCGNRLSESEQAPVSPKQPLAEAMESPQNAELAPMNEVSAVPSFAAPVLPSLPGPGAPSAAPPGEIVPPVFFPIVGGPTPNTPPGTSVSPTPPVYIPEPDTVVLLAGGLGSLSLFSAFIRRRRKI